MTFDMRQAAEARRKALWEEYRTTTRGTDFELWLIARMDAAEAALRELVRLKNIKDAGPMDHATALRLGRDYEASKPAAWAEARRIVGSQHEHGASGAHPIPLACCRCEGNGACDDPGHLCTSHAAPDAP